MNFLYVLYYFDEHLPGLDHKWERTNAASVSLYSYPRDLNTRSLAYFRFEQIKNK